MFFLSVYLCHASGGNNNDRRLGREQFSQYVWRSFKETTLIFPTWHFHALVYYDFKAKVYAICVRDAVGKLGAMENDRWNMGRCRGRAAGCTSRMTHHLDGGVACTETKDFSSFEQRCGCGESLGLCFSIAAVCTATADRRIRKKMPR